MKKTIIILLALMLISCCRMHRPRRVHAADYKAVQPYTIVDTGQIRCYDDRGSAPCPAAGEVFYGQDAQYTTHEPHYIDNGDGTILDLATGLMWQKAMTQATWSGATADARKAVTGNYTDWRVPTIKELYSLINFNGSTGRARPGAGKAPRDAIPYIDTQYFDFEYSPTGRYIDAQYITGTSYVSTVFNHVNGFFGVNFADGRIKCYPKKGNRSRRTFYARYVRGNPDYGKNEFKDNGDGTITDHASGLTWMRADSGDAIFTKALWKNKKKDGSMDWKEALSFCENLTWADRSDWRLPDAKQLQSIVDYTRSPDTTGSAAIDPVFETSRIIDEGGNTNYPAFWSSTTHLDGRRPGANAVYVAFGEALGFMKSRPSNQKTLMDVHGAGAQRSDPKTGNPDNQPKAKGPQGDIRRVYNFVRCPCKDLK